MNGMRGTSWPLFWAAVACLATLCVLSVAEVSRPTANFGDSSSSPPPMTTTPVPRTNSTREATTNSTLQPTTKHTTTLAQAPESCEVHPNCTSCVESKNVTCYWTLCTGTGYCSENSTTPHCTVGNSSSNCFLEPTTGPSPTNSTAKPSPSVSAMPAVITVVTTGAPNTTVIPTPSTRKSSFDTASFIGGIVLVLSLQALVFFLYKFCKFKERKYCTL